MGTSVSGGSYSRPPSWLRYLDVNDLSILSLSHNGVRCCDIAKILCISFPAVSQRLKKISMAVGYPVFFKSHGSVRLTDEGKLLAENADSALKLLCSFSIGTLPEEKGETNDCGFLGPGD